jgi:hypothetical protein
MSFTPTGADSGGGGRTEKQQNYKPHLHSNYVLFTVFTTFEWISDAVNDMTAK